MIGVVRDSSIRAVGEPPQPHLYRRFSARDARLNVFRSVVGDALAIVAVGVAVGECLTVVLTGIVASVQQNIGRTALSTHVIVGLIWVAIGVTASYVPAARAARLDPSVALREE